MLHVQHKSVALLIETASISLLSSMWPATSTLGQMQRLQ